MNNNEILIEIADIIYAEGATVLEEKGEEYVLADVLVVLRSNVSKVEQLENQLDEFRRALIKKTVGH